MKKQTIQNGINRVIQNIRNFSLTFELKDQVNKLSYERDISTDELYKLKKEYDLIKKRNQGFKKIQKGLLNADSENSTEKALKDEINRLIKIIDSQAETIEKKPFLTNKISILKKPKSVKSLLI